MGITEILRMFWLYSATRYKKLWLHSKHSTNCWTHLIIAAHNCHTCMKLYFFYSRSSHWLVVPKPGWPQASRTGLSMKFLESDKFGNQHFTFDHSASYQTIQKRFFHAVDSFNPEFIIVRVWFQLNPPTKILTSYAFVTRIPTGELLSVPFTFQIFWKIG